MAKTQFIVVEDNEVDVRYLRQVLSRSGVTAISHARDGAQAVAYLKALLEEAGNASSAGHIVMLLDLNLPVLSGFDVLQFVQDTPALSRIKIFVVTSVDDESARKRAEKAGAAGYIVKPLSLAQVANILETIDRAPRWGAAVTSAVSES